MTTGMTKEQTRDLTPRGGAPPSQGSTLPQRPAQAPIMRRSRSLSELPGSVRVPILKRTDNERMKARLEAGYQGLQELKLLREQQQKQMEDMRNNALLKKPVSSQGARFTQSQPQMNQRRMSNASLRLSSQSLARINEEGDDNGGAYTNGRLQDCTNLTDSRMHHRRHSSFNLESNRHRIPSTTADVDVFVPHHYGNSDVLRKTQSWSAIPASYDSRTASSESLNEGYKESPNQFTNFQNKKNQRSMSFCIVARSTNDYMRQKESEKSANSENIEPKLRRASIQCDAVITGSNKKNQGIFKDVDLSNLSGDSPGPLHAVLHGFKANQAKVGGTDAKAQHGVKRSGSFAGSQTVRKTDGLSPRSLQGSDTNLSRSYQGSDTNLSRSFQGSDSYKSRSVQGSDTNLSHRTVQRPVIHRRALSETDSIVRNPKGITMPGNIIGDKTEAVNNYFRRHSGSGAAHVMNGRSEKHNSVLSKGQENGSGKQHRSNEKLASSCQPTRHSPQDAEERRLSEGNVFVDDKDKRPTSREVEDKSRVIRKTSPRNNDRVVDQNVKVQKIPSQSDNIGSPKTPDPASPVSVPFHEKKFSIASDEGYVTSPPSTPIGRHAHSIVSDSSWISTDFDDTSSSCDVSPLHVPRDLGFKATSLQLKRSDLSHDYSKAKLSRRSSDYGSSSDFERTGKGEDDKKGEAVRQELFRYDSCESLPFRQTAV